MAKKADLLKTAQDFGLEVTEKNTIAEIEAAIESHQPVAEVENNQPKVAKAGKRSAKALEEAEEKAAKEARKASGSTDEDEKKRNPKPIARPKSERRGKKYKTAYKKIDQNKTYSLEEALSLAAETSTTTFDASVELHIRLNVDPKHADQNIRDSLVLPEGTGKTMRVAVFADEDDVKKAKAAGADVAGTDDFLQQLDKEIINFDVLVATPAMMARLSKYARLLGPKGLMPNPKSGTVTTDIEKAVKESKGGKVEYRVDETGIIHMPIGKVSFGATKLMTNAKVVMDSIQANKPSSVKGSYFVSCFASTSMGPSIQFEI